MKKLDTTFATTTISQPAKGGTFLHLQQSYQEILSALAQSIVGVTYQTNVAYVLFGCVNSGSGSVYNISAGAVFYNGEAYLVPAASFTAGGSNVAVGNITTSYFVDASADPVTFSDTSTHNVHQIRQMVITAALTGSGTADYSAWLQTQLTLVNDQEATLGSSYTVKFNQDKAVYFAAASVSTTFTFDYTNAIPGAVVRLQWDWTGSGSATITVTAGSGAVAYEEGGDITRAASHKNSMYFVYLGKDGSGNNVVGYSISQIA